MYLRGIISSTLRNFRKNLISALIKIIGVAVSIATVVIIWSFVVYENKFDKDVPTSERIFRLETNWAEMPSFLGHAINQDLTSRVISTRLNFWGDVGIQVNNNPFNIKEITFADSTFFKIFPLEFITGNPENALVLPFSLVLSESQAKRLFGSTDVVGKTVKFDNQFDFKVTAIIKDQTFLHFNVEVLASMVSLEEIRYKGILKQYDGWSYPTYLLFPEGISIAVSEKNVFDLLKKAGYKEEFKLRPFTSIYYSPEVENESNTRHGNLLYNKILIAVSIFILILSAINFINLTIADAVSRSKEVSIKKVEGASEIQLIIQFVLETALTIIASFILSFFLLWIFNPLLSSLAGFPVYLTGLLTPGNVLIILAGLTAFIIITGTYPGIYISKYTINSNKERLTGHSGHNGIRIGLIIFQNLVSITLICCTLIASQQFRYISQKDLGFSKNDIVNLKLNSQFKEHLELFKEKLSQYPEIKSISYSSRVPGSYWGSWCCVNIEGNENKFFNNYVDPEYLGTLGIGLKEGRNFSAEDPGDMRATYLINETAVKQYDLKNPIGQFITPGNGKKGQIIGVIKDFHYRGLNYEKTPLLLFYTPDYVNYVNIKVDNNNIRMALNRIKTTWNEICPAFAFEYSFLDQTYDLQYKSEKRFETLLLSFAILALFIASIGLFGLSIYSTGRRIKEIGIRKINGARVFEIIAMLNTDLVKWVIIAYIIACPIAWYAMYKWLQNFAYKTDLKLWIFALAGLLALGIALLTVSWQSWRAATRNPVEALRYE
jgi:putative ABC transport system permease protein